MDFALPKMDLVAVPGKGGAMENWGLLTMDSESFLVNATTEVRASDRFFFSQTISLDSVCQGQACISSNSWLIVEHMNLDVTSGARCRALTS